MERIRVIQGFHILTEYEYGRAQIAIEWVARSQKPIVEIGGRPLKECNVIRLARDLNDCIVKSGESVRAFIAQDNVAGHCCYGFYRYSWAMQALLMLLGKNKSGPIRALDLLWMRGLVFGYSPDAIQRFIAYASREQAATVRQDRRTIRRVEIYVPVESHVRGRNK